MTNLQVYKLSLFERCEAGDITEEERDLLLEAVSDEVIDEIELEESCEGDRKKSLDIINEGYKKGVYTDEDYRELIKMINDHYDDPIIKKNYDQIDEYRRKKRNKNKPKNNLLKKILGR